MREYLASLCVELQMPGMPRHAICRAGCRMPGMPRHAICRAGCRMPCDWEACQGMLAFSSKTCPKLVVKVGWTIGVRDLMARLSANTIRIVGQFLLKRNFIDSASFYSLTWLHEAVLKEKRSSTPMKSAKSVCNPVNGKVSNLSCEKANIKCSITTRMCKTTTQSNVRLI